MMDADIEPDSTNPTVESETRLDSTSVHSITANDNSTAVAPLESVPPSVAEASNRSIDSSDVNNRSTADSNNDASSDRSHSSVKRAKTEKMKVKRKKEPKLLKQKETTSPVYDSMISMFDEFAANGSVATDGPDGTDRSPVEGFPGHGFEVGDMVWGKVKSHPWWPGHIFSEKFATPSVRRLKRDGLLLVAFFGDSSYGWFHPSELIPFDTNYAEKSTQTNSKTFVKAVEEAMDEVSRRSALGLSCMCRSKGNFREADVAGYYAVDVADYEPGAVYSMDAIEKAREGFEPGLALDFVRRLALEPVGREHGGVDFVKNKAKVVSYRRAVYEEFDETYAQAFGYDTARSSSGSGQESVSRKTPSKAPLSGRQVFADSSGKGKSSIKLNKPKDQSKKDKYLFKRRDEPKEVKTVPKKEKNKVKSSSQLAHIEDDLAVSAGDFVLQKRVSATTRDELPSKDSAASIEDKPVVGDPGFQTIDDNDNTVVSQLEDKKTSSDLVVDKSSSSGPHKTVSSENEPKKVKKRPVGETGSEKQKKRKKEQLTSDGKVSAKKPKPTPSEVQHGPDDTKPITTHGTKDVTGPTNETDLSTLLGDLFTLALDPLHAVNRGKLVKTRQVFLKFRSLVFQKSLNLSPSADDDDGNGNATHSGKSSSDPTLGGRKRGPSDRQEEMAARKKKKVGEIRNLTKEKKVMKKVDEPHTPAVKQSVIKTLKKLQPGHETVKKTDPSPTMLMIKFPQGGSLPSNNELKARFARFGPLDHSATRIYWNTFACRLVYKYKAHAEAAQRFVVGNSSLFGNTGVKCTLKEVGGDSEPPVRVPKEDYVEDRPTPSVGLTASGVQLKSILKKSGGDEVAAAGNGGRGRVKFMLGGEESQVKNNMEKNFSKSHSTMDINSKNFQKAVLQSSNPLPPLLPLPTSSTTVISSTSQFTRPPPPLPPLLPLPLQPPGSMHYATPLAPPPLPPPPRLPPPPSLIYGGEMAAKTSLPVPNIGPPATPKVDISHQMLNLLTKCNEVVANVTNMFGYVPYRPL